MSDNMLGLRAQDRARALLHSATELETLVCEMVDEMKSQSPAARTFDDAQRIAFANWVIEFVGTDSASDVSQSITAAREALVKQLAAHSSEGEAKPGASEAFYDSVERPNFEGVFVDFDLENEPEELAPPPFQYHS